MEPINILLAENLEPTCDRLHEFGSCCGYPSECNHCSVTEHFDLQRIVDEPEDSLD